MVEEAVVRTWLWRGDNVGTVVCVEVGDGTFFNIDADGTYYLDDWAPKTGDMWVLA